MNHTHEDPELHQSHFFTPIWMGLNRWINYASFLKGENLWAIDQGDGIIGWVPTDRLIPRAPWPPIPKWGPPTRCAWKSPCTPRANDRGCTHTHTHTQILRCTQWRPAVGPSEWEHERSTQSTIEIQRTSHRLWEQEQSTIEIQRMKNDTGHRH